MSISVITLINAIWQDLHASSQADAVFWSDAQITREINDHLRHLCQSVAIDIRRDTTTITLVQGQAIYTLPVDHLSTISVALDGITLRPSSTYELERRDTAFQVTQSSTRDPVKWRYEDKQAIGNIGFYRVPGSDVAGHTVEVVYHALICDVDTAHTVTTIALPPVFGDWLEMQVDADLYGIESDGRCLDVSQAYSGIAGIYMQAFEQLYGKTQ